MIDQAQSSLDMMGDLYICEKVNFLEYLGHGNVSSSMLAFLAALQTFLHSKRDFLKVTHPNN